MKARILGLVLGCIAGMAQADGHLSVSEGWVRLVPPVSDSSAAYFTLANSGDTPAVLVAADSDAARTVEIHTVEKQGDVMQMKPVERLSVPAGEQVRFQPGSYHIMLIGLNAPLQEGKAVALTLRFAGGETLAASLPVQKDAGGGHHPHHADHEHHQPADHHGHHHH